MLREQLSLVLVLREQLPLVLVLREQLSLALVLQVWMSLVLALREQLSLVLVLRELELLEWSRLVVFRARALVLARVSLLLSECPLLGERFSPVRIRRRDCRDGG